MCKKKYVVSVNVVYIYFVSNEHLHVCTAGIPKFLYLQNVRYMRGMYMNNTLNTSFPTFPHTYIHTYTHPYIHTQAHTQLTHAYINTLPIYMYDFIIFCVNSEIHFSPHCTSLRCTIILNTMNYLRIIYFNQL